MKLLKKIADIINQPSKNNSELIVDSIISQTNALLQNYELKFFNRLSEIQAEVKETQEMIKQLEKKVLNQEIRGKQNVGHMTYKIEEISNKLKKSN